MLKTMRAVHDPIIVHSATQAWEPPQDNPLYKDTRSARLKQNIETPIEDRIEYATWPETTVYFSTVTMDSKYMSDELDDLYQYTFSRYLEEWTDLDVEKQPAPLTGDSDLTAYQLDRIDDLRFGIKKDRDKYFVEEVYETLDVESVPKAFWLTEYERERRPDQIDDFAASVIADLQREE